MPGKSPQCMQKPGIVFSLYDRLYCVVKSDASIASSRCLFAQFLITLEGSPNVRRFYEPAGRRSRCSLCHLSGVCLIIMSLFNLMLSSQYGEKAENGEG